MTLNDDALFAIGDAQAIVVVLVHWAEGRPSGAVAFDALETAKKSVYFHVCVPTQKERAARNAARQDILKMESYRREAPRRASRRHRPRGRLLPATT